VLTAAVVSAAAAWDKPFTEWSDRDVEKVLNDSPWAGKASLTHEREGGSNAPVPDWKLIVSVRSALPVRQALVRQALGAKVAPPPEAQAYLTNPPARYALAIGNIARSFQTQLTKSAQMATLKPKHREPMTATDASVLLIDKDGKQVQQPARGRQGAAGPAMQTIFVAQGGGGFGGGGFGGFGGPDKSGVTAMLIVEFPKTPPLTADDDEVELSTVIGGYRIKKVFKLKDMSFQGGLAF
jgi:hypothetical protein